MPGLDNNNKFSSIFLKEIKNKLYVQRDEPDLFTLHDEPIQYAIRSDPVNEDEVFQKTIELRTGIIKHFPAINVNDLDEATRCLARHQGLEEMIQQNAKELKNIEEGLSRATLFIYL